jgi:hypothetical protein
MELRLYRKWYSTNSTIGELSINGTYFCDVLEDVCRDNNRDGDLNDPGEEKVHGKTCIPAGRYQVIIDMSTRFKKLMPLLVDVPGFAGIRIHPGNTNVDTDGCLLVGHRTGADFVANSRDTFGRFFLRLTLLLKTEKAYITIIDSPAEQAQK